MAPLMDKLRAGITTASADETRAIAERLAADLPPGTVLALHGDLGAGKTTFTQGLARGLGIQESVTSPTFNIFTLHRGAGKTLVHLDAYRLDGAARLEELMIDDFLVDPWWAVVEWPGNVAEWLPPSTINIELGIDGESRHTLRLR